jgi:hypothetical protein
LNLLPPDRRAAGFTRIAPTPGSWPAGRAPRALLERAAGLVGGRPPRRLLELGERVELGVERDGGGGDAVAPAHERHGVGAGGDDGERARIDAAGQEVGVDVAEARERRGHAPTAEARGHRRHAVQRVQLLDERASLGDAFDLARTHANDHNAPRIPVVDISPFLDSSSQPAAAGRVRGGRARRRRRLGRHAHRRPRHPRRAHGPPARRRNHLLRPPRPGQGALRQRPRRRPPAGLRQPPRRQRLRAARVRTTSSTLCTPTGSPTTRSGPRTRPTTSPPPATLAVLARLRRWLAWDCWSRRDWRNDLEGGERGSFAGGRGWQAEPAAWILGGQLLTAWIPGGRRCGCVGGGGRGQSTFSS